MHKAGYALACNGHGIGNKLKCIASAIWNANYNQSQVAVRWVNYNKRDDATADQIFCPRFLEKLHPDLGKHEITYSTWSLLVPERLRSIVPPSTVNFWSHKGAFIDFEYCRIPQIIRGEVVSVFQEIKLNPIIYDAVEAFIKKNETLKIGVHARLWGKEANDRGVDKEELIQSLHRISRRLAGEHRTKILVCTDHKESAGWIYDAAQQCFPESQVIRPEFSGWDLNNQQQALAEIVLLSRLPKLIASRSSTFSEVAWWIGGARLDMLVGLIGRHKSNIRATEVEEEEEAGNGIINIGTPDILKDPTLTIIFKELGFSIVSRAGVMRHLDTPNLIAQAAIQYALHYRRLMNSGRTDEIMLDVGANIGLCSLPVASMGRTVYAFDALPENL